MYFNGVKNVAGISANLNNGTKYVSVYDNKNNCVRTLNVQTEEADNFISTHHEVVSKKEKQGLFTMLGLGAIGTAIGLVVSHKVPSLKLDKITDGILGAVTGAVVGGIGSLMFNSPRAASNNLNQELIEKYS